MTSSQSSAPHPCGLVLRDIFSVSRFLRVWAKKEKAPMPFGQGAFFENLART
jgi:hypothetical protein